MTADDQSRFSINSLRHLDDEAVSAQFRKAIDDVTGVEDFVGKRLRVGQTTYLRSFTPSGRSPKADARTLR